LVPSVSAEFVLLTACAKVANLLLDRAAGCPKEMGIRAPLSADRARFMRQDLTESIVLSLLEGAVALLLG